MPGAKFVGNGAVKLNRQVADAAGGIQQVWLDERFGGASIQAGGATAVVGILRIVVDELMVGEGDEEEVSSPAGG
jgi:hypothetical protein